MIFTSTTARLVLLGGGLLRIDPFLDLAITSGTPLSSGEEAQRLSGLKKLDPS